MSNDQELLDQLTELITATTALLEEVSVSKETLDSSVNESKANADTALAAKVDTHSIKVETETIKDEAILETTEIKADAISETTELTNQAITAKNESVAAKDDAVAIVHSDEGELLSTPGAYPVADSKGHLDINWTPHLAALYPYSGVMGSVDKGDVIGFRTINNNDDSNRFSILSRQFNINGHFVEILQETITLPKAESTPERAIAFDDIFLDWNGNAVTYRSITAHRTATGFDRDAIATEHGYSKISTGLYKTGDSYALLLGRVTRRNMGAYHPVYNPEGARAWNRISSGNSANWYIDDRPELTKTDAFVDATHSWENGVYGYRVDTGYIGATTGPKSGRSDNKSYDAIYSDDFTPLYYSAKNVIDRQALLFDNFNRAVAGETFMGAEGTTHYEDPLLSLGYTPYWTASDTDNVLITSSEIEFLGTEILDKATLYKNLPAGSKIFYSVVISDFTHSTAYIGTDKEKLLEIDGDGTLEGSFITTTDATGICIGISATGCAMKVIVNEMVVALANEEGLLSYTPKCTGNNGYCVIPKCTLEGDFEIECAVVYADKTGSYMLFDNTDIPNDCWGIYRAGKSHGGFANTLRILWGSDHDSSVDRLDLSSGSGDVLADSGIAHFYKIVRTGTTASLYDNLVLVGTDSSVIDSYSIDTLMTGNMRSSGYDLDGQMYYFSIKDLSNPNNSRYYNFVREQETVPADTELEIVDELDTGVYVWTPRCEGNTTNQNLITPPIWSASGDFRIEFCGMLDKTLSNSGKGSMSLGRPNDDYDDYGWFYRESTDTWDPNFYGSDGAIIISGVLSITPISKVPHRMILERIGTNATITLDGVIAKTVTNTGLGSIDIGELTRSGGHGGYRWGGQIYSVRLTDLDDPTNSRYYDFTRTATEAPDDAELIIEEGENLIDFQNPTGIADWLYDSTKKSWILSSDKASWDELSWDITGIEKFNTRFRIVHQGHHFNGNELRLDLRIFYTDGSYRSNVKTYNGGSGTFVNDFILPISSSESKTVDYLTYSVHRDNRAIQTDIELKDLKVYSLDHQLVDRIDYRNSLSADPEVTINSNSVIFNTTAAFRDVRIIEPFDIIPSDSIIHVSLNATIMTGKMSIVLFYRDLNGADSHLIKGIEGAALYSEKFIVPEGQGIYRIYIENNIHEMEATIENISITVSYPCTLTGFSSPVWEKVVGETGPGILTNFGTPVWEEKMLPEPVKKSYQENLSTATEDTVVINPDSVDFVDAAVDENCSLSVEGKENSNYNLIATCEDYTSGKVYIETQYKHNETDAITTNNQLTISKNGLHNIPLIVPDKQTLVNIAYKVKDANTTLNLTDLHIKLEGEYPSARPQFLMVDIIGAREAMPEEWLIEGIPGNWLKEGEEGESLIPDGTEKNYKLSRKCLECYQVLYTRNKGETWGDPTSVWKPLLEGAANSRTYLENPDTVHMMFYRTAANPFELIWNNTLSAIGFVHGAIRANVPFIPVYSSNLLGKVLSFIGSGMRQKSLPLSELNYDYNQNGRLTFAGGDHSGGYPIHEPLDLVRSPNDPAIKTLHVLTSYGLQIIYKEMKHDGVSWGDDCKFDIISNQSTVTDLNGEKVIVGQKRVELPYHFDGIIY